MSIALGQPRLKAVLDIPDFLDGTGNLASLGFLLPQSGPRKCWDAKWRDLGMQF